MRTTLVMGLFFLVFVVGSVLLQIFLSKRESRWPGLVLPILTFLWSAVMLLNVASVGSAAEVATALAGTFLFSNIPTILYLAIYFSCREKRKRKKQIDKMNIQDLD